jgi:hypothetical protein
VKTVTIELSDKVVQALSARFGALNTPKWEQHIVYFLERNFLSFANETQATVAQLENIEALISDERYDEARELIRAIRAQRGEFPWLVRLQAAIDVIDFLASEDPEEESDGNRTQLPEPARNHCFGAG